MTSITKKSILHALKKKHNHKKDAYSLEKINTEGEEVSTKVFVDDLFSCFSKKKFSKDGSYLDSEPITDWSHVNDLDQASKCFGISRQQLKDLADCYYKNQHLWCQELDWFFADSLLLAEIIAMINVFNTYQYYVNILFELLGLKISSMSIFLKLGIKISIVLIAFEVSNLLGWLCINVLGFRFLYKVYARWLLSKMINVYTYTSTINFNWRVLRAEMDYSRKAHVVWDVELYNLADIRIANPSW